MVNFKMKTKDTADGIYDDFYFFDMKTDKKTHEAKMDVVVFADNGGIESFSVSFKCEDYLKDGEENFKEVVNQRMCVGIEEIQSSVGIDMIPHDVLKNRRFVKWFAEKATTYFTRRIRKFIRKNMAVEGVQ